MFKTLKTLLVLLMLVFIALPMALPTNSAFLPPNADMLSRICFALLATYVITVLFKSEPPAPEKPEPETVYLLGSLEPVTLYESYWGEEYSRNVGGYYSTPEKAFLASPSNSVRPVQFYKVGDRYIDDLKVRLRDLGVDRDVPKPKETTA